MKIRLLSRRFIIAVFLPVLLLCAACGTESAGEESSFLSASVSAAPTHTETALADLATNPAPHETTSGATEPETDIPYPYEGDMALIFGRAVSFAAAASRNEWQWNHPYQELSGFFKPESDGSASCQKHASVSGRNGALKTQRPGKVYFYLTA